MKIKYVQNYRRLVPLLLQGLSLLYLVSCCLVMSCRDRAVDANGKVLASRLPE